MKQWGTIVYLIRREPRKGLVPAFLVIKEKIISDGLPSLGDAFIRLEVYLLIFEASPKAFNEQVSSPGESHPQALSEPGVNLSAHRAPIIQPTAKSPFASGRKAGVHDERSGPANVPLGVYGN
jgi:hypothetical protein